MKVGIIGSGKVGGAIGIGLAKRGHAVVFSSRDPLNPRAELLAAGAQVRSVQETVHGAEVLVVALPWNILPEVLGGLKGLEGKILIDATNRFGSFDKSAGEELAALVPGVRVVKAFNTIGFEHMDAPAFAEKPTMLLAGNDAEAKQTVARLAQELGFEPLDAGPLSSSAALEAVARAWVGLTRAIGRNFAFRILQG
ncbi:MAG: NAD(P)-binding domain-containing protein [Meiothermus sp.]|nr:NAD(P)-binding domain-containing protein [Meiothermus sp.]